MEKTQKNGFFKQVIKGALSSVIVTLLAILAFALVIKFTYLSNGVIKSVNQFIKVVSVFLGCVTCISGKQGLIKGLLVGVLTSLIIYLIFSLCGVGTGLKTAQTLDLLFLAIIGAVSGIISVNVKK